jgi:hypothetical protein
VLREKFSIFSASKKDSSRASVVISSSIKKATGDKGAYEKLVKEYDLRCFLRQKCDEELTIDKAKHQWRQVRRKVKVLRMLENLKNMNETDLNEEIIQERINQKKGQEYKDEEEQSYWSKFIISPGNYWNMLWNNLVIFNFIVYVLIIPVVVSFNPIIPSSTLHVLLIFDIVFFMDRILDLLVGY